MFANDALGDMACLIDRSVPVALKPRLIHDLRVAALSFRFLAEKINVTGSSMAPILRGQEIGRYPRLT